jgi:hypothetical protein
MGLVLLSLLPIQFGTTELTASSRSSPLARRSDVSTSQPQPSPAAAEDDIFAGVFPRHNDYPWNERPFSATDLWQQQASRAVEDENPYALVHVPRNDRQSQYQDSPVPATSVNINLGVHQIAAHNRAGSARPGSFIPQPRTLAEGFNPAGPRFPPPGLTHPNLARSPSPVPLRPSHPSPGHVRATPQGLPQSPVPYSPSTSRGDVPRRFWVTNVDTDVDPLLLLNVTEVCNYLLCSMSDEC